MTEHTISLLICDDQDVVRKGLNTIFRYAEGINVVGLAVDGEDGVAQTLAAQPDVVLMDLKMPKLNGIHATRRICTARPQTKVIVLTTYDTDEWVFDAVRAGASGYLLKDATGDEIVTAVRETFAGNSHLDPKIAGKILTEFNRLDHHKVQTKPDDPVLVQLSDRELSILRLMAQGKTNQEIAEGSFFGVGHG